MIWDIEFKFDSFPRYLRTLLNATEINFPPSLNHYQMPYTMLYEYNDINKIMLCMYNKYYRIESLFVMRCLRAILPYVPKHYYFFFLVQITCERAFKVYSINGRYPAICLNKHHTRAVMLI